MKEQIEGYGLSNNPNPASYCLELSVCHLEQIALDLEFADTKGVQRVSEPVHLGGNVWMQLVIGTELVTEHVELLDLCGLLLAENSGRGQLFSESGNGGFLLDDGSQSLLGQLLESSVPLDQIVGGHQGRRGSRKIPIF